MINFILRYLVPRPIRYMKYLSDMDVLRDRHPLVLGMSSDYYEYYTEQENKLREFWRI